MGYYESIRFKCIVKEEFRKDFEPIALGGEWTKAQDKLLREFGKSIDPFKIVTNSCDEPEDWAGCDGPGEEYETCWNSAAGKWICAFTYKRQGDLFFHLLRVLLYIVEKFEVWEEWIESDEDYPPKDNTDHMNQRLELVRSTGGEDVDIVNLYFM